MPVDAESIRVVRLPSLKDGVSTRPPSKRFSSQVSEMINALPTVERSVEKRPGTWHVDAEGATGSLNLSSYNEEDLWIFETGFEQRKFLVVVNLFIDTPEDIIQIFDVETGLKEPAPSLQVTTTLLEYLRTSITNKDNINEYLRNITLPDGILLLNTDVNATLLNSRFVADDGTIYDGRARAYTYPSPVVDIVEQVFNEETGEIDRVSTPEEDFTEPFGDGINIRRSDATYKIPDPLTGILEDNGQNVEDFSQFTFPPTSEELLQVNNGFDTHEDIGAGAVWYTRTAFNNAPVGFYQAVSNTSQPWYQRIRTQELGSKLDPRTFPLFLKYKGNGDWSLEYPNWVDRLSGDNFSNPGPTIIAKTTSPYSEISPTGAKIKAMTFWRNRLWFASGNTIFTSRINEEFNLWIDDVTNLTDVDPVDISASSSPNNIISWLQPFSDYMFVTTNSEVQYELKGSQNVISASTAVLEPTTYYGTSSITSPLTVGSLIYFFADRRMYLYFGNVGSNINNALEISSHARNYLPDSFGDAIVAPNLDTILASNGSTTFCYTARWQGEEQLQSAFFKWQFKDEILKMVDLDNSVYFLFKSGNRLFLDRMGVEDTLTKPKTPINLDRLVESVGRLDSNGSSTLEVDVPYVIDEDDFSSITCFIDGRALKPNEIITGPISSTLRFQRMADFEGYHAYVGYDYLMSIELSRQFIRDENLQVQDGILNLNNINLRYYRSGEFDVVVEHGGHRAIDEVARDNSRTYHHDPVTLCETIRALDSNYTHISANITEHAWVDLSESEWLRVLRDDSTTKIPIMIGLEGEFSAAIQQDSARVKVFLESNYCAPVQISDIEFRGRFRGRANSPSSAYGV